MEAVLLVGAALALFFHFGQVPTESVILLPDPEGRVGKVLVQRGEHTTLLDEPYEVSRAVRGRETANERLPMAEARREFGAALAGLPARPMSYTLFFEAGNDELTEESKAQVARLLEELRLRPSADIVVIGHTDRLASDEWNDVLSLERAERIKAELIQSGIDPTRLSTAARGEREPLVPTDDGIEEPRNRRVEITVR